MTSKAIERAHKLLDATSAEQDARMIAGLIHGLGSDRKASRYTKIANRIKDDAAFVRLGQDGKEQYVERDDGQAKTPDGEKCESWKQRIENMAEGIEDLWREAEESGLGTKKVEDELRKLQEKADREAEEKASVNGAEAPAPTP